MRDRRGRVLFGVNGELEPFSPPWEETTTSPGTLTWMVGPGPAGPAPQVVLRGGHEESVQGDGGGGHRWK